MLCISMKFHLLTVQRQFSGFFSIPLSSSKDKVILSVGTYYSAPYAEFESLFFLHHLGTDDPHTEADIYSVPHLRNRAGEGSMSPVVREQSVYQPRLVGLICTVGIK